MCSDSLIHLKILAASSAGQGMKSLDLLALPTGAGTRVWGREGIIGGRDAVVLDLGDLEIPDSLPEFLVGSPFTASLLTQRSLCSQFF